jgi:uncharacterized protein (DUF58 family)
MSLESAPAPQEADRALWRPTVAHARAVVVGAVGLLVAIAFHRADVLVAVTPLLVVATWAVATRPSSGTVVTGRLGRRSLREGEATTTRFTMVVPEGAQEYSVACTGSPWVEFRPEHGVSSCLVRLGEPEASVELVTRMTRWGHHAVGPAAIAGLSSWGAYQWGPSLLEWRDVEVLPVAPVFDARAPIPHPQGLVGIDRSSRPGDGSEFASIRPFQVGDRLRRIHWPSSLRSDTINVTAMYADHDSQVMVLVDAASEVGVSGGIDGAANTLDATVRAATALCEHYVRRGDRVGITVTGASHVLRVRPSTGQPQLRRILASLADVRSAGTLSDTSGQRMRVDAGALVLMCSPLISSSTMDRAVSFARRGFVIVVIDTLPQRLQHLEQTEADDDALTELAWRIRMLERESDVRRVTSAGVPVVPWHGPGSLDQVLRDISRRARAPRLAPR